MAENTFRTLLSSEDVSRPGRRTTYKLSIIISAFLLSLIGCVAASVLILLTSKEDSVQSWRVRPAVLLSIVAALYAVLLGGLFTTGVAVVWWRSINHGTNLKQLHLIHAGATSQDFLVAFIAGGHARRVALAALVAFSAKLAAGPLLQLSSRPELHSISKHIDLDVDIVREIPAGWFGAGADQATDAQTLQDTFLQSNITTRNAGGRSCPSGQTCAAKVEGAGLNYDCKTSTRTVNVLDPGVKNTTLFDIDLAMDNSTGYQILYLDTQYVSDISDDCVATITTESCNMIPAIILYTVRIEDNMIMPNLTDSIDNLAVVFNTTSTAGGETEGGGTLDGIRSALLPVFQSRAVLKRLSDGQSTSYSLGQSKRATFWADVFHRPSSSKIYSKNTARNCPLVWNPPAKPVMEHIFGYMFRSAIEVAKSESGNRQSIVGTYNSEEQWYITDFRWLAASMAVMALGIAAALVLVWGWWQLHHCATLSPLEVGKVFGAPIFTSVGREKEANSIVQQVGQERVAFDGRELVWSGSVYTTGNLGSLVSKYSAGSRSPLNYEKEGGHHVHTAINVKDRRKEITKVSNKGPERPRRPSFEHNLGYTTRQPYNDEEEMDIGQYGRGRSNSHANDTSPLIPAPLNTPDRGPRLPPIPTVGSIRLEQTSPCSRVKRMPRCAADVGGRGRRPLTKISERNTPPPEELATFI